MELFSGIDRTHLRQFRIFAADSVAALGVAVIIPGVSFRLEEKAINALHDSSPKKLYKEISDVILSITEVKSYHDLKIRVAGHNTFVNITLHLDTTLNISDAHEVSHKVEQEICRIIDRCEMQMHYEPAENN
jgi:divalent metal cation (Fe/Co/Zn/Cd) transporter